MLKRNSIKVHLLTRQPELEILVVVKSKNTSGWPRIGNFLIVFNKAHTYYPTYDIEAYFSDWTLAALCWILFMKTFCNVISSIICCAKEARASIVLDWLKECNFVLQNCEKLQNYSFKQGKKIMSEVCMIKKNSAS